MTRKNLLAVALGIMSAIGGFVDIGDLVFNTQAGSIFGFQLLWVVVLGVGGIIVFSEMCGRVAAVSQRPVFDLVRERTGFGPAFATLIAAELVTVTAGGPSGRRTSSIGLCRRTAWPFGHQRLSVCRPTGVSFTRWSSSLPARRS